MMPEAAYAYVEVAMQEPPSPDFVSERPVYQRLYAHRRMMLPSEDSAPLPCKLSSEHPLLIHQSSEDDADDEEEDGDEDEEEHLALLDFVPPPVCRTTARISIRDQTPIPFPSEAEVDRLLAISTPPPSLLTSYSTPLPQIPSSPLPVSSPLPISPLLLLASPTHPLGYRAAMIQLRAESPSTSHPLPLPLPIVLPHTRASMAIMRAIAPSTYILTPRSEVPPSGILPLLPIPLPTSSPPFLLPFIDYRADILKVTLLPQKRLCITPGPRYKVRKCSPAPTARPTGGFKAYYDFVGTLDAEIRHDPDREIGYGITDVWVDLDEITEEIPMTDVAELGQRMTNFVMTIRQDTYEIYGRLDDAQDDRSLMSGQLNLLHRDRRAHARTARLMESEARASCEAWVQSMDASDMARFKTQMASLQSQQRPARDPAHPDVPKEAGRFADVLTEREATRSRNGKGSHDSRTGVRRQAPLAREYTYPDFMKCKPLYFKGTKGVVELTQLFERMENVFLISNCFVENQIKFATCTLLGSALT
ncbi:hypothetical protein Tco_1333087 [Tanacetum coccineum]